MVKLSFGVKPTPVIICGQSRLELRKSSRMPRFEGDRIVVEDDAFIHGCLVYPDHIHEFEHLKARQFQSGRLPIVMTETDQISPPPVESTVGQSLSAGSVIQIATDPAQGLLEFTLPEGPPKSALILRGEDQSSGNPSFLRLFQIAGTFWLREAVTEVEAIQAFRSQQMSSISMRILGQFDQSVVGSETDDSPLENSERSRTIFAFASGDSCGSRKNEKKS